MSELTAEQYDEVVTAAERLAESIHKMAEAAIPLLEMFVKTCREIIWAIRKMLEQWALAVKRWVLWYSVYRRAPVWMRPWVQRSRLLWLVIRKLPEAVVWRLRLDWQLLLC